MFKNAIVFGALLQVRILGGRKPRLPHKHFRANPNRAYYSPSNKPCHR